MVLTVVVGQILGVLRLRNLIFERKQLAFSYALCGQLFYSGKNEWLCALVEQIAIKFILKAYYYYVTAVVMVQVKLV